MNKETMTSRERMLAAINHEPVDRVPFGLGGNSASSISAFAYQNLREYLGFEKKPIMIAKLVLGISYIHQDIMERFHLDTVLLAPPWKEPVNWNPRGDYNFLISSSLIPEMNGKGEWIARRGEMQMRMPQGGYFFDGDWLIEEDFEDNDAMLKAYRENAERIYKDTGYFTLMPSMLKSFFEGLDMACDMYTDPELVIEQQERSLEKSLKNAEKIIRSLGEYIQGVTLTGDLGGQTAPLLRPTMYEQFCYPYLKKLCDFIHANSDLKIFLHSCGAVEPLIPYLIDAGIDVLNPVQISAAGMNPTHLKKTYGKRIAFWGGGCDTQAMLDKGSPKEIASHVKELMSIFKEDSGYVFAQVHNIMGNVKPENIVAMMDAAYENSFYNTPTNGGDSNEPAK